MQGPCRGCGQEVTCVQGVIRKCVSCIFPWCVWAAFFRETALQARHACCDTCACLLMDDTATKQTQERVRRAPHGSCSHTFLSPLLSPPAARSSARGGRCARGGIAEGREAAAAQGACKLRARAAPAALLVLVCQHPPHNASCAQVDQVSATQRTVETNLCRLYAAAKERVAEEDRGIGRARAEAQQRRQLRPQQPQPWRPHPQVEEPHAAAQQQAVERPQHERRQRQQHEMQPQPQPQQQQHEPDGECVCVGVAY